MRCLFCIPKNGTHKRCTHGVLHCPFQPPHVLLWRPGISLPSAACLSDEMSHLVFVDVFSGDSRVFSEYNEKEKFDKNLIKKNLCLYILYSFLPGKAEKEQPASHDVSPSMAVEKWVSHQMQGGLATGRETPKKMSSTGGLLSKLVTSWPKSWGDKTHIVCFFCCFSLWEDCRCLTSRLRKGKRRVIGNRRFSHGWVKQKVSYQTSNIMFHQLSSIKIVTIIHHHIKYQISIINPQIHPRSKLVRILS